MSDAWEKVSLEDAAAFVRERGVCSESALQRRFGLSWVQACQVVDTLAAAGVVGPWSGDGKRVVYK